MMLPIYVIALKESTARREKMTERLQHLGLDFHFIDAVMGKDLPDAEKNRLRSPKRQRFLRSPLSDGALGCLMSHRLVWQKMQDDKVDMALVLEDDAVISPDLLDVLPRLEKLKSRFDVINLHNRKLRPLVDIAQISDSHRLTTTRYNAIGTESYVISRKAAKRLLEVSFPMVFEVDLLINRWWDHGLQTLVVQPSLVHEDSDESTIGYSQAKPLWPNDTAIDTLKRRFNRAKDSMAKRRSFAAMVATAKMRLIGTDPAETSFNPEYPDLRRITEAE